MCVRKTSVIMAVMDEAKFGLGDKKGENKNEYVCSRRRLNKPQWVLHDFPVSGQVHFEISERRLMPYIENLIDDSHQSI